MNVKKVAGFGCGAIVAVGVFLLAVGFALPSTMELETDAELAASPDAVFPYLQTVDGLTTWWGAVAAEAADAPAMEVKHLGGPKEGEGLEVGFASGDTVFESWKVTEIDPPKRVVYDVDFKIMQVTRTITLEPTDEGTHATWHETAEIGNPVMRWMTFLGEQGAVENFDTALRVLAKVSAT